MGKTQETTIRKKEKKPTPKAPLIVAPSPVIVNARTYREMFVKQEGIEERKKEVSEELLRIVIKAERIKQEITELMVSM